MLREHVMAEQSILVSYDEGAAPGPTSACRAFRIVDAVRGTDRSSQRRRLLSVALRSRSHKR
jgi:hypothetical protein